MEKCTQCKEVITVTYQDIKAIRNSNGSEVLIKSIPTNKCECDSAINFRVGLEMTFYKHNDNSYDSEVNYSIVAMMCKDKSNMELIDPQGKLR